MAIGLIITIAGLLIIVTRGPLIFSPGPWRDKLTSMFMDSDANFRRLGLFMALVAVVCYVVSMSDVTTAGQWVRWLSALVFVVTIAWVIVPGPLRTLALSIWNGFNETVLRVIGVLAVLLGLWLVYYGGTLVGASFA